MFSTVHIVGCMAKMQERGNGNSSLARFLVAIRSFCKWLKRMKIVEKDIAENIECPKADNVCPVVPTHEEIDVLLSMPDVESEKGVRDKAILELLYSSGLRASELCRLTLEDWEVDQIRIQQGKGRKTRTIPTTKEATHWINSYISLYRGRKKGLLFLTLQGKKLNRDTLRLMIKQYVKKTNIRSITTHSIRHACATHLFERGANLRLIQEVLGHSTIASTQRYTHLSSSAMQSQFKEFHPRKNNEG
jgi:integrase/recombinase XerD